jgi:hypothetical protein
MDPRLRGGDNLPVNLSIVFGWRGREIHCFSASALDRGPVWRIVTHVRLQLVSQEPRERNQENGLLLTAQSNRVVLKIVAPPNGWLATEQFAQFVP